MKISSFEAYNYCHRTVPNPLLENIIAEHWFYSYAANILYDRFILGEYYISTYHNDYINDYNMLMKGFNINVRLAPA